MRVFLKAGLVAICLMLVLVQGVPAFSVSNITINPRGAVTWGTPFVVTGTIDFTPSTEETFESSHELLFNTSLDKAEWTWTLVVDGVETPQPALQGYKTTLSGWVLSYPRNTQESLKFRLEGAAPSVSRTTNKTIIEIQEVDEKGIPVPGTRYVNTTVVVNPNEPPDKIRDLETELSTFKSHIDEKAADGINTTLAEAKYTDANQKLDNAEALPSSQYLAKFHLLDSAQTDIDDGERLLEKAWAEKEVADAQVPITRVDGVIAWFKGNRSTADDPQLPAIITKREIAVSYLETAWDDINKGNFEQARAKAKDAYNKGNESYNEACAQSRISGCGNNRPPKPDPPIMWRLSPFGGTIIVLFIAGILCVAGFFWWKRRKRWSLE
jgi:hypothetical protein